jgi:hypothetical protein
MADTQEEIVQIEPRWQLSEQMAPPRSTLWHKLALGGIMLISIFMNFFQLGQNAV